MDISTGALTTVGVVFLAFFIFGAASRTISRIMGLVGIGILLLIVFQAKTGVILIDFSQLADFFIRLAQQIAVWAEETLWPSLTEFSQWLEKGIQ